MPFAGLFFGVFLYGFLLAPFLLLALAVPYAILRLRDGSSGPPDPHLGLRAGLYFFFSAAVIVALNGLTIIAVDLMIEKKAAPAAPAFRPQPAPALVEEWPNPAQRIGMALVLSGFVFAVLHLLLVKVMTDDRKGLATRRIFAGWRFAIHGLVVLFAFTAQVTVLFQKDFGDAQTRNALWGLLIVWVPSWAIHLALVSMYSRRPATGAP
jgi:hypothetical protein